MRGRFCQVPFPQRNKNRDIFQGEPRRCFSRVGKISGINMCWITTGRQVSTSWAVVLNILIFTPNLGETIQFDKFYFRWVETTK